MDESNEEHIFEANVERSFGILGADQLRTVAQSFTHFEFFEVSLDALGYIVGQLPPRDMPPVYPVIRSWDGLILIFDRSFLPFL